MAVRKETIEAIEAAGLSDALNELGDLLASNDGKAKHGDRGWETLTNEQLTNKCKGHVPPVEFFYAYDADSSRTVWAHVAARALMATSRVVNALRAEKTPRF